MPTQINSYILKFNSPDHFIVKLYLGLLTLNALSAYSFSGIPLPWLANVAAIGLVFILFFISKIPSLPGMRIFFLLFILALLLTIYKSITADYDNIMPPLANSSYSLFISLRFLVMLSFAGIATITYFLCKKGYTNYIIEAITTIGFILSIYAIYVYFAQLYNLPELPRTRAGTDGWEQHTSFSYPFHRAMGTFREPSHLAEWLIVPYFFSFFKNTSLLEYRKITIGIVLVLTGSITGIIGVVSGIVLSFCFVITTTKVRTRNPVNREVLITWSIPILLIGTETVVIAGGLSLLPGNQNSAMIIMETLYSRINTLLAGGLGATNRAYIYDNLKSLDISIFGYGIGNANILITESVKTDGMASFLSLYSYYLYGTGIIGLLLLLAFLAYPVIRLIRYPNAASSKMALLIVAGYAGWLVMYFGHSEELTLLFGVLYGLLVYLSSEKFMSSAEIPKYC